MAVMAQPTQDTDISSSFTPIDFLRNDSNFYSKETTVDEKTKMTSTQIYESRANVQKNYQSQECRDAECATVNLSEETFPWLGKFNKLMCSSVGNRSYRLLQRLLTVYKQNILTSMNTCCIKTFEIIKLKNHLCSTLTFFHFYWHDIKEHVSDHNAYLNEMSALLGIYVDAELKTCREGEDSRKVAAKLLTALWIYLNNSEKHIFRVLLRLKLIAKKYVKICDPLFMKSFTSLRRFTDSVTDVDYVRYLLALKLWKRTKENSQEKKKLNKFALITIGPRMPVMCDELLKILPKPPAGQENETVWLLQPNVFDLRKACDQFLAFEETLRVSVQSKDSSAKITDSANYQKSQTVPIYETSYLDDYSASCESSRDQTTVSQNKLSPENETGRIKSADRSPTKQRSRFKKHKPLSKLKPGEVVLIDLTEEVESPRTSANKKRKKRSKRKLEWLKMTRKRHKLANEVDRLKSRGQVEIADAHSTDRCEPCGDKAFVEHLPISDNKVSESTEICSIFDREPNSSKIAHDYVKRNKETKCTALHQQKQCEICALPLKQEDLHNRGLCLLRLLTFVGQNIKDPKTVLNLLAEGKQQNAAVCQASFPGKSAAGGSTAQSYEASLLPQQRTSTETIFSSLEWPSNAAKQPVKQELPTSSDYNLLPETGTCCQSEAAHVDHHGFRSCKNYAHVADVLKLVSSDVDGCGRSEVDPCACDALHPVKTEDPARMAIDERAADKKTVCEKSMTLSDLDKCVDVLSRIGEHIMSVHAEKHRLDSSDNVSTTVFGDQVAESSPNVGSLANSEKLNRFLELYGKKEFVSASDSREFPRSQEPAPGADASEQKLTQTFCSHVKTEFKEATEEVGRGSGTAEQARNERRVNAQTETFDAQGFWDQEVVCESLQSFPKSGTRASSLDEFENIDILDSILNGDMTMEDEPDILEDSHASLMSPIIYDNSTNVLNCITDFFTQSEHAYTKREEKTYAAADMEVSPKPLPEGSLGTTGILNSLLDFDLTNMDSPLSDFMYSNVQTVNPRLIKKSIEEGVSTATVSDDLAELKSRDGAQFTGEKSLTLARNDLAEDDADAMEFRSSSGGAETMEIPSMRNATPFADRTTEPFCGYPEPPDFRTSKNASEVVPPPQKYTVPPRVKPAPPTEQPDTLDSSSTAISRSGPCKNPQKQARKNLQENAENGCKNKEGRAAGKTRTNAHSKPKRKLRCDRKNKEEEAAAVEPEPEELSLRCSQLTFNPSNCQESPSLSELPVSSFHVYRQKSGHAMCPANSAYKQLKCVGFQQLKTMSCQRKQQILLNFHGTSTADAILEDVPESPRPAVENSPEETGVAYKPAGKSSVTRTRSCFKFSKRNAKVNAERQNAAEAANNNLLKPGTWPMQGIDAPSSKFLKKQLVATNLALSNEETPLKRRKVSSKFLDGDTVVRSVNQQAAQEKRLVSVNADFVYTTRRKNAVVR